MFIVVDIDECSLGIEVCQQLCHNTPGSYICDCLVGYEQNGDECAGRFGVTLVRECQQVQTWH